MERDRERRKILLKNSDLDTESKDKTSSISRAKLQMEVHILMYDKTFLKNNNTTLR